MRVAVTGTTGRVGAALAAHLRAGHEVIELPRSTFDLADPVGMHRVLDSLGCEAFLNPAGLTSLEACEDDPGLAHRLNVAAPGELAAWATEQGVKLVHFSTDYVFSGEHEGLRTETEDARPLSEYGRTKRAGEIAVLEYPGTSVVRVSWVFGPEKPSFIDGVVRSVLAGRDIEAVADKFSLPTHTRDLSEWIGALIPTGASGIFHACQSGEPVSWHGMAEFVAGELVRDGRAAAPGIKAGFLDRTPGFRAARPRHTAMATARLAGILGAPPRHWQDALRDYLRECR